VNQYDFSKIAINNQSKKRYIENIFNFFVYITNLYNERVAIFVKNRKK
jgi:hypothetical protein